MDRLINLLLRAAARYVYEDMRRTVALVRSSDCDWTVVRVPMLTNSAGSGQVKVGMVGNGIGARISREDLAGFMLKQLTNTETVRRTPAISN